MTVTVTVTVTMVVGRGSVAGSSREWRVFAVFLADQGAGDWRDALLGVVWGAEGVCACVPRPAGGRGVDIDGVLTLTRAPFSGMAVEDAVAARLVWDGYQASGARS